MSRWNIIFLLGWISVIQAQCPTDGILVSSNPEFCYIFKSIPTTFDNATIACAQLGGVIATIDNAFTNSHSWVGRWGWIDDSNTTYQDWLNNQQPNGSQYVSAVVNAKSGYWTPASTYNSNPYVCAVRYGNVTACPGYNYVYYPPTNKCYKGLRYVEDWNSAEYDCQRYGGHLASLNSLKEDIFVAITQVIYQPYLDNLQWIVLKYSNTTKQFEWSDGSPATYFRWAQGFPQEPISSYPYGAFNFHSGQFLNFEAGGALTGEICEIASNFKV
uniref:C-type lectin domain-containing protein n=1 Tax=Panagrolaimus sp. PS1159 TaxID=55785 RepID=A0AC35FXM1_9BILA